MDEYCLPKMYTQLAEWWQLISDPEEYIEEARLYYERLTGACAYPPRTMLELGCGGGNNASHLKAHFEITMVDLSPDMLEVSRRLNPECEHIQGDMRTIRLERQFDTVFIHDAVCYMATEDDLKQAITTAFFHCRDGGAVLFVPDYVQETFKPGASHGGRDRGKRGLRYLEWVQRESENDIFYTVDFAYLLREGDGPVRVESDRHTCGLFSRSTWVRLLEQAGFSPELVSDPQEYELFIGSKP